MIGKTLQALASGLGKSMGKRVAKDMNRVTPTPNNWTHSVKIDELSSDYYLSADYLRGLIKNSDEVSDVRALKHYLTDASKTSNLSSQDLASLKSALNSKIEITSNQQMREAVLEILEEYGKDIDFIDFLK